jgi:carbohydrate diacid regulator
MTILNAPLAQQIVERTMKIIAFNVNVMDARGTILASGDASRIGELHAGALLALAKKMTVEIDDAAAQKMHGAQAGINLPLMVDGQVCGAVGLSGAPDQVRQFGELVRLTAEMILEQAGLIGELQRNARYREAFVLNLLQFEHAARADLQAWGRRLGLDFTRTQLVFLLELDDGAEDGSEYLSDARELESTEIQRLQVHILSRQPGSLTAAVGPREMVILDSYDPRDAQAARAPLAALHQGRLQALASMLREQSAYPFRLTMGIAMPGIEGVAISYQSAREAARLGRLRRPSEPLLSYYDLVLPVLLSGLESGWQAEQLRRPVATLRAHDKNDEVLRRTLDAWLLHDAHPAPTAAALHIHRNTLDYRLRRIAELTGLDLGRIEDRLMLYVSSLLDCAQRQRQCASGTGTALAAKGAPT